MSHLEEVKLEEYLKSCYSGYDLKQQASLDVLEDIFTSSEGFSLEKGRIIKSREQIFASFKTKTKISLFFMCSHNQYQADFELGTHIKIWITLNDFNVRKKGSRDSRIATLGMNK